MGSGVTFPVPPKDRTPDRPFSTDIRRGAERVPPDAPYSMVADRSWLTVGAYVVLALLVGLLTLRIGPYVAGFLVAVLLLYLGRYLSVVYTFDRERLLAWRIFGWRSVPLRSIRRVQPMSLRDIAPVGMFGTWGWRSRLWSPLIGRFDAVSTTHRGLLVTGEGVPLFISPRDPEEFGRRLSHRVEEEAPGLDSPWASNVTGRPSETPSRP
jgi:hypothetical protein